MLASYAISAIVQGIQNIIKSNELLAKSAQEVSSKFNEQKTQLEDYRQKITQLKTVQESSASTTEEVKDATAQLYTIQNDLIGTYGSYHQGIDLVNKDLETQLGLLKDINQNNAQKALDEINSIRSAKSSGRNVLFNLGESSLIPSLLFGSNYGKKYNDQLNSGDNWWQAFKNTATGTDIFGEDRGFNKYGDSVSQINDMVNKFDGSLKTTNKTVIQLAKNFDDAFEVDADGVIHYVGNIYEINDAVTRLRVQLKNLGITDEEVFNQLSNTAAETQKRITAVGDSYNTIIEGEIYDNQSLTDSYNTLINIHDKYLAAQEEADPEKVKEIGDEYVDAFAKISESGIDDKYVDFFRDLYPELQGLISEWEFEVKIKPTFNDLPKFENGMTIEDYLKTTSAEELKTQYNRASKNRGKNGLGGWFNILESTMSRSGFDDFGSFIDYTKSRPEYSDGMQIIRERMGKNWKDEFEEEFAKYDLTAALSIKPKPGDMEYTKEEIEDFFNPIEAEVETKIDADKAVDSMENAKTAITSLNDLWQQTVQNTLALGKDKKYLDETGSVLKQADTKNQAVGYADPAMINQVESAFSKFSEKLAAEGNEKAANEINQSLKNFERTLVEFPGDADKAQAAMNELITAYIDQTDIIKNLTKENAAWSIEQLKAYGIENAEIVVMSRLGKQAKDLTAAYSKLRDEVQAYNLALEKGDEDGQAKGIANITDQLNDMYGFIDHSGKEFKPFDTSYVSQNMDTINDALNDTSGRFNELDRIAGKKYVADLIIGADDTNLQNAYGRLWQFIDTFDGQSIDIGSSMDGSPIFATLEQIRVAIGASATEWQQMISMMTGGTITAQISTKEIELPMPVFSYADWLSDPNRGAITSANVSGYTKTKVQVPEMSYTYNGKGASANYKPPSTGGTGGGGGGGGGGNADKGDTSKGVTEDDKQTFDWIEVKIKRLEEAVSRLDKQVNNTFSNWTKRNNALGDEISKVTEEIKAQERAEKQYGKYAKNIANVGKGKNKVDKKPKKEDYKDNEKQYEYDLKQWEEANRIWKEGRDSDQKKYQDLIKNGLLGKDDIEKIQNKYLVNLINEYQTWYDKSVAAKDAAEDLRRELQELNKQKFDNVTQQFDELITTIDKNVDLIQKRIDRTEALGFWVDESYYKKQETQYKDELANRREELKEHIAKLNAQAKLDEKKGGVGYRSEAWYEMYNQIKDDNIAIEELTNNIVDLNEKVKQLEWDKFDYLQQKLDDITNEAQYLQDILTSEKTMDEFGYYNERGWANAAMVQAQYIRAQDGMNKAIAERNELEKKYGNDVSKYSQTNADRWQTLTDSARDYAKAMMQAKDAMKQLVEESVNTHLSKLKELMDEYKETLSAAKDLYDWQKNVANQTETITKLRKQLTAYESDDSEAARKRRIELRNQLNQAEQQLQETEWDRYISETGKMLDNLYEDYEDILNARFDNIDVLLEDEIEAINNNKTSVSDGLKEIANKYGVPIDRLNDLMTGEGSITSSMSKIETYVNKMQDTIENGAMKVVEKGSKDVKDNGDGTVSLTKSSTDISKTNSKGGSTSKSINTTQTTTQATSADKYANMSYSMLSTLKSNYEDQLHSLKTSEEKAQKILNILAGEKDKTNAEIAEYNRAKKDLENYRAQIASINTEIALITRNMLKKKAKGYASGSRSISSNQLAWTQEDGTELIFRTSDGAILTPLNQGDMVFTNEMTQRLWDIAKSGIVPITTASNLPNTSGSARAITTNNQIEITLPNVQDYSSFKKELQNDNNFEKFIQEVTVGQLRGNNTLNKRKY